MGALTRDDFPIPDISGDFTQEISYPPITSRSPFGDPITYQIWAEWSVQGEGLYLTMYIWDGVPADTRTRHFFTSTDIDWEEFLINAYGDVEELITGTYRSFLPWFDLYPIDLDRLLRIPEVIPEEDRCPF